MECLFLFHLFKGDWSFIPWLTPQMSAIARIDQVGAWSFLQVFPVGSRDPRWAVSQDALTTNGIWSGAPSAQASTMCDTAIPSSGYAYCTTAFVPTQCFWLRYEIFENVDNFVAPLHCCQFIPLPIEWYVSSVIYHLWNLGLDWTL